jgi:hypothetical protein
MNYESALFKMSSMPDTSYMPVRFDQLGTLNITDLLVKYKINPDMVKMLLSSILPSDFDFSEPFAKIPFKPLNLDPVFKILESFGLKAFLKPSSTEGISTITVPEGLDLSLLIPGFPSGVDWKKIFVPGGFIANELDEVLDKYLGEYLGVKGPAAHVPPSQLIRTLRMQWGR